MKLVRETYHFIRNVLKMIVAPIDIALARGGMMSSGDISDGEKGCLKSLETAIHWKDGMYIPFEGRHYLEVGISALRCVERGLAESGSRRPVNAILDLPSGYGRVIRFLRVRFPGARITASEIDRDMLNFCQRKFAADMLLSNADLSKVTGGGAYDLIWCGSLFTHIDKDASTELLRFFYSHLSDGGTCLFSAHGEHSVQLLRDREETYGLTSEAITKLLAEFHASGYGYADYKHYAQYGISVVSRKCMVEMASNAGNWRETTFIPQGWDHHHDVYGFTR
jgi:trans-aconitate methyltransferase